MEHPSCVCYSRTFCSSLDVTSDLIDFVTSSLKGLDSFSSCSAVVVRPLEKLLQVVADVVDRIQFESTVGAKNCLFQCFVKNSLAHF